MGDGDVVQEKTEGKPSRFVNFLGKVLLLFENIPKAVAGIGLIISLIAGTAGFGGMLLAPDSKQMTAIKTDITTMKKEIVILEIWNKALRERTSAMIASERDDKIEFDGYMLDLSTGDIEKLKNRELDE